VLSVPFSIKIFSSGFHPPAKPTRPGTLRRHPRAPFTHKI
jgi:hypothetical protein